MPKRGRSQLSKHTSQASQRTAKISRIRQSSIENENRLASQREYASQSLARESSTELSQRLDDQNVRTSQARARESSTERSQRLDDQNARTSHGRTRESNAERSLRLTEQNARTLQLYASQTFPRVKPRGAASIIHRKNPPKKAQKQVTLVDKILSSTRTICTVHKEKENLELCPSCMWGPKVGYDDVVWHKLGTCPWWPARVLTPGDLPSCLLSRSHSPHQWPLKYYGTLNHSWGDSGRMCLFLPKHTRALQAKDELLRQAVLDAADDYIAVYLT